MDELGIFFRAQELQFVRCLLLFPLFDKYQVLLSWFVEMKQM